MAKVDPETLMRMLAHAPGFVVWTDEQGYIRWVSRTDGGFRPEDVIGRPWSDFLRPRDARVFQESMARSGLAPQTTESTVISPDGRSRRFVTRSAPVQIDGEVHGHVHVVSDASEGASDAAIIDERERAAALLQAQARRTAQILETMHDGYLLVGQDGVILDVNLAYARAVGRDRDELIGMTLADLADDAEALLERLLRGDKRRFDTQHRHADGHWVELEVSASIMQVDDVPVATMFVRNVTGRREAERDRRELEGQVRHKHKLEALGTLASGVAHEINNPIQGILGFAQLIQGRSEAGGDVNEFAGEIIVECGRIARIVSNLLAFARRESDSQTPSDVGHLVLTTLSLLKPTLVKDGIDVEVDIPEDLPPIACRGDQIRQVVMNLLTNARDALNARFRGADPDKRLFIRASAFEDDAREWARIEVEDHGTGIEGSLLDRIFDPFFTTKSADAGTGLGLAVSHRIVADHGGHLRVDSRPGEYTRFSLELPVESIHDVKSRP